jgi:hypothetical protein
MNFEVELPRGKPNWILSAAGLRADMFTKLAMDYFDGKISLPVEFDCEYFLADTPVNPRITVFDFGGLTTAARVKVEVSEEVIGKRIREIVSRYSVKNNGEAIIESERNDIHARINQILSRDRMTIGDIDKCSGVISQPTLELLMKLFEGTDYRWRGDVSWVFKKELIAKADRPFVAKWLVNLIPHERNPSVWSALATPLMNGLVVPEIADALISLIKDKRYGLVRGAFCEALCHTKDPRAAGVIVSVVNEADMTRWALECLGKLRAAEYIEQIRGFVRNTNPEIRREAKRSMAKLGFPVEAPPPPVHLVKKRPTLPRDLEEWSADFDIEDLIGFLEKLSRAVDAGFGPREVSEVAGVADRMKPDQSKTFAFPITICARTSELWLTVYLGDINTPAVAVYATPDVIKRLRTLNGD